MWVRLFLFGALIYAGARVVSAVNRYLKSRPEAREISEWGGGTEIKDMVRDPICGLYVSSRDAVTGFKDGRTVYFCSEECKQRFMNGQG